MGEEVGEEGSGMAYDVAKVEYQQKKERCEVLYVCMAVEYEVAVKGVEEEKVAWRRVGDGGEQQGSGV